MRIEAVKCSVCYDTSRHWYEWTVITDAEGSSLYTTVVNSRPYCPAER